MAGKGGHKTRKTLQVHRTTLQKAARGEFERKGTNGTRQRRTPSTAAAVAAVAQDVLVSKRSRKGWTLAQAQHVLAQGYTEQHVRELTGWPVKAINTKEKTR